MAQGELEDKYVKRVYHQIIALAFAMHVIYAALFFMLGFAALAAYNAASALFYCAMQFAVRRGHYRLAVSCIHFEVCVFTVISALTIGWGSGIALYLVAMASLVYFCPFSHKYIPYLFAVMEICVFMALKLYTHLARPGFLAVPEDMGLWLYASSAFASFFIILFSAFTSNVSATVSRQALQAENRQLTALANYDQLTGLLSRHAFLARMERPQGVPVALALGDIDDFKVINDTWGHACGDLVLNETAELFRRRLRGEVDICRWGGEEFVFLFRDMPLKAVQEQVRGLCEAVAGHVFHFGQAHIHITMTFGVSLVAEGESMEAALSLADKRMYAGKACGKNRVV